MQWFLFKLYWGGDEGLICLKNLVGLGTTQIELEGWISSPQPLNSTGREVRARGTVAEKGLISLRWVCVDVLESRLVLV